MDLLYRKSGIVERNDNRESLRIIEKHCRLGCCGDKTVWKVEAKVQGDVPAVVKHSGMATEWTVNRKLGDTGVSRHDFNLFLILSISNVLLCIAHRWRKTSNGTIKILYSTC